MSENQMLTVQTDFDIITARMKVRKLARAMGLKTVDQACISMATSSLAQALGLGEAHQGQIVMECWDKGERTGLRVVCTKADALERDFSPSTFDDMKWMVDELTVETLPPGDVQVTLVKWLAS
jgi:anti-sigma regulatory factor (Ser/Thr protein kinase)